VFYLAQVTRPVPFPCFGVLHKEKNVLLHSVADVVVEQGAVFPAFVYASLSSGTNPFFFSNFRFMLYMTLLLVFQPYAIILWPCGFNF
jgi:hypothetical protein